MKSVMWAFIATAGLANVAAAETQMNPGYAPGALASTELANGELRAAEAKLNDKDAVAADDPARLINLGQVYAKSGRFAAAREMLVAAYRAPSVELLLADGRTMSSRTAAAAALADLRPAMATR